MKQFVGGGTPLKETAEPFRGVSKGLWAEPVSALYKPRPVIGTVEVE